MSTGRTRKSLVLALALSLGLFVWWATRDTEGTQSTVARDLELAAEKSAVPTPVAEPVPAPAGSDEARIGVTVAPAEATSAPVGATGNARLVGRVTRVEDGTPVVGAAVRTDRTFMDPALTDADGRYVIEFEVDTELHSLEVGATSETAGEHRYAEMRVTRGSETTFDLQVNSGASLSGRVVDERGDPVPGSKVLVWCRRDLIRSLSPDREVTTDNSGAFQVAHVGSHFVMVGEAPGYACALGLRGQVTAGQVTAGLEISLTRATVLEVRCVDARSRPVPGVRLSLGVLNHMSPELPGVPGVQSFLPVDLHQQSDEEGRFRFEGIPAASMRLRTFHTAFLAQALVVQPRESPWVIELQSGVVRRGRVQDRGGAAVAGASVGFRASDGTRTSATTDDDGTFLLRALTPSRAGLIHVKARGFAMYAHQPIEVGDTEGPEVLVTLDPGRSIAGQVVDAQARAVPHAAILVEGDRIVDLDGISFGASETVEYWCGQSKVTADDSGRFRIDELYDGSFALKATSPLDKTLQCRVEARAGEMEVRIVLDPTAVESVRFSGRVMDSATGLPVRSFVVTPMSAATQSGRNYDLGSADGSFVVPAQDPGGIEVLVKAPGYAEWSTGLRDWVAGSHRLEVTMAPVRGADLVVVDAGGKQVQVGCALTAKNASGRELSFVMGPGMTSKRLYFRGGQCRVEGLPGEVLALELQVGSNEETHPFELDLRVAPREPIRLVLPVFQPLEVALFLYSLDAASAPGRDLESLTPDEISALHKSRDTARLAGDAELTFLDSEGKEVLEVHMAKTAEGFAWSCVPTSTGLRSPTPVPLLSTEVPGSCARVRIQAEGHAEREITLRTSAGAPESVLLRRL